jgi:ribosomal protein L11 methyltransferase
VIKPSWESYIPDPSEQVIVMDPGMAFGTGQHASTQLALGLIHDSLQNTSSEKVLDIGTGTGILAMAAVLFGAGEVTAIDNDPEAVRVAAENITANNLQQAVSTSTTDLAEITGDFDLICANIVHDVLVDMAPTIAGLLSPGGRLILSGILQGRQEKNIIDIYQKLNITLQQSVNEGEWVSLLLTAA